ncbi:MAG: hypothetical protein N7Q72_00465, partial [Spiroplasma sp. Tabriz.8]|nr:hypothetical protein [Spiroplasma sp. Tabriz.8]MCZ8631719.1 hypothetical protein [Spiroplasma sp. Tabriz.8]
FLSFCFVGNKEKPWSSKMTQNLVLHNYKFWGSFLILYFIIIIIIIIFSFFPLLHIEDNMLDKFGGGKLLF